jgi:nitrate reductase NapAB chaperone NapD
MVGACVFIKVAASTPWADAAAMHTALHGVPGVKGVYFLMGPTDIVLFIEAADQKALMETLGKVRAVKGVASTDSRSILPV